MAIAVLTPNYAIVGIVVNAKRIHQLPCHFCARLSEPRAIGSTRPATCQNRRLKLSAIKGALQTDR